MSGELHEISRAIGALETGVKSLQETQTRGNELFDQHCKDDDQRHIETIAGMQGIKAELTALRQTLEPLAASVSVMRPIVDGYQLTRSRLTVWASIGFGILVFAGWIVETAVKWMVGMVLSHWH